MKKVVTQGTTTTVTRFVYGPTGILVAEYEGETVKPAAPTREYYYGATGLLAISENGDIKYLTPDHLGSPRIVTNTQGQVLSRRDFFPFGENLGSGLGGRTPEMGFDTQDHVRQKFTGYQRDDETGLDFAQARYYGNGMGRFLSADRVAGNTFNPQSLNRYTYCLIRLISCGTGSCTNGVAQNLANKLGATVTAPTGTIWIHPNGTLTIGPTQFANTGTWATFTPGRP